MRYAHVIQAMCASPWAILPERLQAMVEVVDLRLQGTPLTAEEKAARIEAARPRGGGGSAPSGTAIAVIPIVGTIMQRADMFDEISGAITTTSIGRALDEALDNPQVGTIVFEHDTPGGNVFGVQELGAKIAKARETKRTIAAVNSLSASAGYWLASQAGEIVITPGGLVGSIGVYTVHIDSKAAYEQKGFKPTLISAGKFKVESHPLAGALEDDARASIQERIDGYYDAFVDAVAEGRKVKANAVREGFGEGRVVSAKKAVELGMADRVLSFDDLLRELVTSPPAGSTSRAQAAGALALAAARLDFI